jgi:hypothetical protein
VDGACQTLLDLRPGHDINPANLILVEALYKQGRSGVKVTTSSNICGDDSCSPDGFYPQDNQSYILQVDQSLDAKIGRFKVRLQCTLAE